MVCGECHYQNGKFDTRLQNFYMALSEAIGISLFVLQKMNFRECLFFHQQTHRLEQALHRDVIDK